MKTKNSGVTLVELIVSMAILGILAITFLGIFSGGFRWIMNAGSRSRAAFSAQQELDSGIAGSTTDGSISMTLRYNNAVNIAVQGKTLSVTKSASFGSVTVNVFIPND